MRRTPRRAVSRPLAVSGALALTLTCATGQAAIDLAGALGGMRTATVATVVLVPPMAVFRDALDQRGLQNAGCHYTTADPGAIRELAAILTSADVSANPVYQRADLREGVYFTMADGGKFSALFADNSGGKLPVMGIAETTNGGQIQSVAFTARSTLSTDVRGWAKTHGGEGTGSVCDLQVPVAEDPQAPPPVPAR
jgi:hypothetical protein